MLGCAVLTWSIIPSLPCSPPPPSNSHSFSSLRHPALASLAPVSRVVASSTTLEMDLSLDVAVDIYPLTASQSFSFQLVSTLHPNGDAAEGGAEAGAGSKAGKEVWRHGAGGIAEEWDYVMYGKVS